VVGLYRLFRINYWSHLQGSFFDFLTLEDGTDRLSRNVGIELPLGAAYCPRRAKISSTPRQKPELTQNIRVHACGRVGRVEVSSGFFGYVHNALLYRKGGQLSPVAVFSAFLRSR
jgi:hypothetical protein